MNNEDEIEILVSEILGSLHKPGSEDRLSAGLAEYGVWDGPGPIPLADRIVSDPRFYMSGSEDLPGPRQWLLGTELVVGEVSVLGGPAGAGKSTYVVTNLLCTVSGKALLGRHVFRKYLRALYISAEDGTDETKRRVAAGCRHHGLQSTEISGLRFFGAEEVDELGLFLVVGSEESATLDETSLKKLEEIIEKWGPAIVAIDPLGSLCPGGVNRNGIMGRLIRALKKIAQRHQCAIWIVHHTKKGGDLSSAEAIGGASAIVNHARVANLMVPMTESEAKACGLPPSHARGHFRVHTAKTNFSAPSTQTEWFKFASINLGNGTPEYPNGDNVQVVERFVPAQAAQGAQGAQAPWFDPIVLRAALATLDTGEPQSDGSAAPFSAAKTMRKRVVTTLVSGLHGVVPGMGNLPADDVFNAERVLSELISKGWVAIAACKKRKTNGGGYNQFQGYVVLWPNTPWKKEHAAAQANALSEAEAQELRRAIAIEHLAELV